MSNLEAFLKHNIEEYMIHDLREMQSIEITYPLLMTTFAGIELLGALVDESSFDTFSGERYFKSYWNDYLYPTVASKESIGKQIYSLLRHGIAHTFLVKGSVLVGRSQPSDRHLKRDADGILYVDAVCMANDFIESYNERVKPKITDTQSNLFLKMAKRADEIKSTYEQQSAAKYEPSAFQLGTVVTTAAVSHSFDPRSKTKP